MKKAVGTYFIILDSDVLLPQNYLQEVANQLDKKYTDAFGGPDAAHSSFTLIQKAINYSMTSILTTGGIRGKSNRAKTFQPRSFNMGISKVAYQITEGFSKMRYGEDIDMTYRLWDKGFKTQLISKAYVYHKRRTSLKQFFIQTYNFGTARPILNTKYPHSAKLTYWFPSLFVIGSLFALFTTFLSFYYFLAIGCFYLFLIFVDASLQNKSFYIGFLSVVTSVIQFYGYGLGFLKSFYLLKFNN